MLTEEDEASATTPNTLATHDIYDNYAVSPIHAPALPARDF